MELPSTTLSSSRGAFTLNDTLAALQPALSDRSFDLGEDGDVPDDVDLNSAFAPVASTSAVPNIDNSDLIDAHDTDDDSNLLEEAEDDDDLKPPEGLEVFSEAEADAMVYELKEIGKSNFNG